MLMMRWFLTDHWAALIAPPEWSAFAAWSTGYTNLLVSMFSCSEAHKSKIYQHVHRRVKLPSPLESYVRINIQSSSQLIVLECVLSSPSETLVSFLPSVLFMDTSLQLPAQSGYTPPFLCLTDSSPVSVSRSWASSITHLLFSILSELELLQSPSSPKLLRIEALQKFSRSITMGQVWTVLDGVRGRVLPTWESSGEFDPLHISNAGMLSIFSLPIAS